MLSTPSFAVRTYDDETSDLSATGKFHLGIGVGSMKTDIANLKTNAISWAVLAGTEINRFLTIDVAYTNLGSTDLGGTDKLKGNTYSLNVVGNIPVTKRIAMFAKFGFANTGVYTETAGLAGTNFSKVAPTIGLGVQGRLAKKVDIRIAYDNYKFIPDNITTNNADITSVSLIYKF